MHFKLFKNIENYLLKDKEFITKKGGMFINEVQQLMALYQKKKFNSLYRTIQGLFRDNMYKYKGFNDLRKFMKNFVSPIIQEQFLSINVTKSELEKMYKAEENYDLKKEMEATLLSFMFLFLDANSISIGAGDIASNFYSSTGLKNGTANHDGIHAFITKVYNNMTNGMVPGSVLELPGFFVYPDKDIVSFGMKCSENPNCVGFIKGIIGNQIKSNLALTHYHFLWYLYNNKHGKGIIFCEGIDDYCKNPYM